MRKNYPNVKQFRKEYNYYNTNPEQLLEDIKYFSKEGINIDEIEKQEEHQKEKDNDFELDL